MSVNPLAIWGPVFAMMALVLVVTVLTFRERVRQFKAMRLHPQKVSTRGEFAAALKDTRCADNFSNLFETPIMFYVACIGLFVTQTVTLGASFTFNFTAPPGPANLILRLVQDGAGSRNPGWPAAVKWAGGTEPVWSTTGGYIDIASFYFDGSSYYGTGLTGFA